MDGRHGHGPIPGAGVVNEKIGVVRRRHAVGLAWRRCAYDDFWPVPKDAAEMKNPVAVSPAILKKARASTTTIALSAMATEATAKEKARRHSRSAPLISPDALLTLAATDGELFYRMSQGRPPMPTFRGKLSEDQRWGLVHYIRTFVRKPSGKPTK